MKGGSDRLLPTYILSNYYCCLTSPFSQEKVWSRYLRFLQFRGFDRTTPGSAPGGGRSAEENPHVSSWAKLTRDAFLRNKGKEKFA